MDITTVSRPARLLTPAADDREQLLAAGAGVALPVQMAALPDVGEGTVQALVSAYDVEYRVAAGWSIVRHVIRPGAFATRSARIPLFYEHNWAALVAEAPIGDASSDEIDEDDDDGPGLRIDGQLYVDDSVVARVWRAMRAGALTEWSIGYRVITSRYDEDEDLFEVLEAELLEASSVLRGANPDTRTLQVAHQPTPEPEPRPDPERTARVGRLMGHSSTLRDLFRPTNV